MKPHLIDPSSDLTHECFALIDAPSLKRKRFPENNVTVVANEAEALAGANPGKNILPAIVFGPSRSSEGFKLYYLVKWLESTS